MSDLQQQIDEIRARLETLEQHVRRRASGAAPEPPARPLAPDTLASSRPAGVSTDWIPRPSASAFMATGAAAAFVLAAVYFVKLVYDTGWLTPERQLVFALLAGIGLIAAGIWLARYDRAYAAYLPATGVVILYVTFYTGHLWYQMLGTQIVLAGVGVTTLVAAWLHHHLRYGVYSLIAVVGAYSFPILLPSRSPDLTEVVLYFAAWGLLFAWLSLQEGTRTTYMLALWLGLTGFDLAWRMSEASEMWRLAATFHFAQFLLFAATAAAFSIRRRSPMTPIEALLHGAALFYFYGIEYVLIRSHAPDVAPLMALASVVVVVALFFAARTAMPADRRPEGGAVLVSAYAAWVTTHVVFFELLPDEYWPWAVLLLPLLPSALRRWIPEDSGSAVPIRLAASALFTIGLMILVAASPATSGVPLHRVALFLYAGVLYVGAWRQVRASGRHPHPPLLLYTGHLAFMVAVVRAFSSGLIVSLAWGLFAVLTLVAALRLADRELGRSALIIFAAFALKVLLVDLTDSPSLLRVGTLLALGASLYVGGWLYRRISQVEAGAPREPG